MNSKTQKIYALRKAGNIEQAYTLSLSLHNEEIDDDAKKATSWVLIDLCKKCIGIEDTNQAEVHFRNLTEISFDYEDSFVVLIKKQIEYLRPKIDISYSQVRKADEASKNGNQQQALDIMHLLVTTNKLSELHHEAYGWIIYRYLKSVGESAPSLTIRRELKNYIFLKNERPSLLHSMILAFALNYAKHTDFNFYNFFKLWNPATFRYDDFTEGAKDGKTIPSLLARICRLFVETSTFFDLDTEIVAKIKLSKVVVVELFREPYFWRLFNAHREKRHTDLWQMFNDYTQHYAQYGPSKWHSDILKLAERSMVEEDAWRLLPFFIEWGASNLTTSDWKEEKGKNGETYKPTAVKVIKRLFETIKSEQKHKNIDCSWLIALYDEAIKRFPTDEWLLREKALLHIMQSDLQAATTIYKQLALEMADRYYIWQEFSTCISSNNLLKIGMLCKALRLERNEDFLGDIHLELAHLFIEENLLTNAVHELLTYRMHREDKGWRLPDRFNLLYAKVEMIEVDKRINDTHYNPYIQLAENYAYDDIAWEEFVLVDKWKREGKKERLTFVNSDSSIELGVGVNRFNNLKRIEIGGVCHFKLHKQLVENGDDNSLKWQLPSIKYIPLLAEVSKKEKWSILNEEVAFVTYINKEKGMVHAITTSNKEVFFSQPKERLEVGSFIRANFYNKQMKEGKKTEFCHIRVIQKEEAQLLFPTEIAVVDSVNELKQLFHYVINQRFHGIVHFSDTGLRPCVGQFLQMRYTTSLDKNKNIRVRILSMEETQESNQNLRKEIEGLLQLKYKSDNDLQRAWRDDDYDENWNIKPGVLKPDFAFIDNYYVPKYLLEEYHILSDCKVKACVLNTGDKWKVYKLEIVEL